jgi:serine/threonine protein kinase
MQGSPPRVLASSGDGQTETRAVPESDGGVGEIGQELTPGLRVGRYLIDSLIGRGAMGVVYAATDPDLHRKVAVKILRSDALSDDARHQMRARLLREAQAMARLSHPEVITVHDVGSLGDQLFVAMEYVEGETLRQWRRAKHRSCAEVLAVYERAGGGLAAAHEAGLIHRDFKPDNVLVGRDGRVRVTDFGLARSVDEGQSAATLAAAEVEPGSGRILTTLTRTGMLLGTPAYMAPEQLRGGAADARSDVFSFCVALYEALYGERPFEGSNVVLLQSEIELGHVRSPPVMTPVPRWLRAVLLRGLLASPRERFASMRALLDGLRAAHGASRRRKARTITAVALVVGVASLAVVARRAPLERQLPTGTESAALTSARDPTGSPAVPAGVADNVTARVLEPAVGASSAAVGALEPSASAPPARPAPSPHTLSVQRAVVVPAVGSAPAPAGEPARRPESGRPTIGNNGALILE